MEVIYIIIIISISPQHSSPHQCLQTDSDWPQTLTDCHAELTKINVLYNYYNNECYRYDSLKA